MKNTLETMISTLNINELCAVNEWAINKTMDKNLTIDEKLAFDEVSDLAIARIAELHNAEIRKANTTKKCKSQGSASIAFGKWEEVDMFGEVEARYLTVDIQVNAKGEELSENLFDALVEKFETTSSYDVSFARCPEHRDEGNGKWSYSDSFSIFYEHGMMSEIKAELMKEYKAIKKELGLR